MRRALPQLASWSALLLGSTAAFALLHWSASADAALRWQSASGHFFVVSGVALIAVAVGTAATAVACRQGNARAVWLALAFLSMAGFFAAHGLATPGFVLGRPHAFVVGLSAHLAMSISAASLALSAVPWPARAEAFVARRRIAVLALGAGAIVGYDTVALLHPQWLSAARLTGHGFERIAWTMVVLGGGYAAVQYFRGYLHSGQAIFGTVALGAVLLMQSYLSLHLGATWSGTFWLYHIQLLFGFGSIGWGLFLEFSRGRGLAAIEDLTVHDIILQLQRGHTESIVSLSAALEARDGYTLGHGERVAALSILIGRQLHLSAPRLRALAAGALLHDVGKIGIPDAVLHKPGQLSDDEYEVIKEHPERGSVMLGAAFPGRVECLVIRHHHERWDGTGYPDGLRAEAIPLEARIAAVADVYDALRSNRAYRRAWTRDDAVALMRRDAGVHFDPWCVSAFEQVVDMWEAQYVADDLVYHERRAA